MWMVLLSFFKLVSILCECQWYYFQVRKNYLFKYRTVSMTWKESNQAQFVVKGSKASFKLHSSDEKCVYNTSTVTCMHTLHIYIYIYTWAAMHIPQHSCSYYYNCNYYLLSCSRIWKQNSHDSVYDGSVYPDHKLPAIFGAVIRHNTSDWLWDMTHVLKNTWHYVVLWTTLYVTALGNISWGGQPILKTGVDDFFSASPAIHRTQ